MNEELSAAVNASTYLQLNTLPNVCQIASVCGCATGLVCVYVGFNFACCK